MASPPLAPAREPAFGALARLLPAWLFEPFRPVRYLALAWLLTFVPALLLSLIVSSMAGDSAQPNFPFGSWAVFALVVVFAPISETLIMGATLLLLRSFLHPTAAVLVSAAGWGIAHSLAAPAWGLVIWWPFLVFSIVFLVWREQGLLPAFAIVSLLHALHNLLPAAGLLIAA